MRLGYSTWGMPTVPIEVALGHLERLGFEGVELTVIPGYTTELSRLDAAARRQIRQLLALHHLALPAIAAHVDLLPDDPTLAGAALAHLRAAVDLAVDLATAEGPPAVNTTVGGRPGELQARRPVLIDRLQALVTYAAVRGVSLAIEPHVATALDQPATTRALIEDIASPFLRVNFDISHFNVQGLPIEATVPVLAPLAVHTHVKDERGVVPGYEFLIPGEGTCDYVRFLRAMDAAEYTGFITVEISMMVQQRPGYNPLAAATQSYSVLARSFAQAAVARAPRP